ncbi:TPA: hypothetical protein U5E25_001630 [Yersinia enterocolitica]|nr:hypothetical protein [Yersinia enterocolitica]
MPYLTNTTVRPIHIAGQRKGDEKIIANIVIPPLAVVEVIASMAKQTGVVILIEKGFLKELTKDEAEVQQKEHEKALDSGGE